MNEAIKYGTRGDMILYRTVEDWWSEDLINARRVFFTEFVEKKRLGWLTHQKKRLKELKEDMVGNEVIKICNFYDKIGYYLATRALPEAITLLFWHSMQKTWLAIRKFVDMEREQTAGYYDPTYMCGFQALYEYVRSLSEDSKNPADMLTQAFGTHGKHWVLKGTERLADTTKQLVDEFNKQIEQQDNEINKFWEPTA